MTPEEVKIKRNEFKAKLQNNLSKIATEADIIINNIEEVVNKALIGVTITDIDESLLETLRADLSTSHKYISKVVTLHKFNPPKGYNGIYDITSNYFYLQLFTKEEVVTKITVRSYVIESMKSYFTMRFNEQIGTLPVEKRKVVTK